MLISLQPAFKAKSSVADVASGIRSHVLAERALVPAAPQHKGMVEAGFNMGAQAMLNATQKAIATQALSGMDLLGLQQALGKVTLS